MESTDNDTYYGQCRCCLAKGYHKDIRKEYFCSGIREVYYEAFLECFNVLLSKDINISKLICNSCVQRLREANAFRMMVVATERQLIEALKQTSDSNKQMLFVDVPIVDSITSEVDIKLEQVTNVKEEPSDCEPDSDQDPDYKPDDEFGVDRATSDVDENFVDGEAELIARFPPTRLLPTRATLYQTCAQYARHLDIMKGIIIIPSSLAKLIGDDQSSLQPEKKVYVSEKTAHIVNASTILECSNITPFRSKTRHGFPCFYCRDLFENLATLRAHTRGHKKGELRNILSTYGAESMVVYADVTDLECSLCETAMPNLNDLKIHLTNEHKRKMFPEHSNRVVPFKLSESNVFECQMCGFNFETFGSIERHMNVHFRNYICKDCGTGFVTKYRLKVHVKSMHIRGSFPCEVCKKVFTTQQKHKNHVNTVHRMVKRFKCTKCPERFSEYFRRQKHMVEEHGVAPLRYRCNVCEKSFDRRYTLSRHMKRDHLEERDFQCHMCTYKCFTNNELRVHMIKHNGERIHECSVCKKSYARKKTLKEHMRIHNNDRRFSCPVCGQAFVQKCSLKGHMKTHHNDYPLPV